MVSGSCHVFSTSRNFRQNDCFHDGNNIIHYIDIEIFHICPSRNPCFGKSDVRKDELRLSPPVLFFLRGQNDGIAEVSAQVDVRDGAVKEGLGQCAVERTWTDDLRCSESDKCDRHQGKGHVLVFGHFHDGDVLRFLSETRGAVADLMRRMLTASPVRQLMFSSDIQTDVTM